MNKDFNWIKSTFLKLTEKTYPYGYEDDLVKELHYLFPSDLEKDKHGNYSVKIGESRTIFASHLDTACQEQSNVTHLINGDIILTDGETILGADDKAGVTIMLWMIKHKIPGLYYFFFGEEVGCIGSGLASTMSKFKGSYDRIISFDRRGTGSVITHQSSMRCSSDEFADELSRQFNNLGLKYKKDDTGVYTDSAEFTKIIPECTNISVGYYKEHTVNEHQDIKHLYLLSNACLKVDWENLPTKRDMNKTESKWSNSYNRGGTVYTKNYNSKTWSSHSSYGEFGYPNRNRSSWDEWDDPVKVKKTRRSKKNGRKFYDSVDGLHEITNDSNIKFKNDDFLKNNVNNSKYAAFKDKFINSSLSKEEIEIIKEQYLDLSNPDDKNIYEILSNQLIY